MLLDINNRMIIMGAPIKTSNITFPISFSQTIIGVAFSQSYSASAHVGRICHNKRTLTGMVLDAVDTNTTGRGAFYIAIGF